MRFSIAALVTVLGCTHAPSPRTDAVATDAASLKALRAAGPSGLTIVLAALDATTDPAARARLIDAATKVAGQKDAHVSRLYWYEDLDAALAAS